MRYVLECVWSGYRASQSRPCHRRVYTYFPKKHAAIQCIVFTDGTNMSVTVRKATFREKVTEIHGYDKLLDDFAYGGFSGWCSVQALIDKEREISQQKATP